MPEGDTLPTNAKLRSGEIPDNIKKALTDNKTFDDNATVEQRIKDLENPEKPNIIELKQLEKDMEEEVNLPTRDHLETRKTEKIKRKR